MVDGSLWESASKQPEHKLQFLETSIVALFFLPGGRHLINTHMSSKYNAILRDNVSALFQFLSVFSSRNTEREQEGVQTGKDARPPRGKLPYIVCADNTPTQRLTL